MTIRKPEKFEHLKTLWKQALIEDVVFDYTNQPHAEGRIYSIRMALYNYRRHVGRHKLRPDYSKEWADLTKCQINRESNSRLVIRKTSQLLFGRKRKVITPSLPFINPVSQSKETY